MSDLDQEKVSHILDTLKDMEYGSIVITVHDGIITQVDATEKVRYTLPKKQSTTTKKTS
ncbi:YezD family protein [Radiobacillus sp. PE A8.2]|uniref:YezD family protein n=1 Tax=Radiobacillus sp. PE A8.2 TaxID=3380349 RepID=UPI003890E021